MGCRSPRPPARVQSHLGLPHIAFCPCSTRQIRRLRLRGAPDFLWATQSTEAEAGLLLPRTRRPFLSVAQLNFSFRQRISVPRRILYFYLLSLATLLVKPGSGVCTGPRAGQKLQGPGHPQGPSALDPPHSRVSRGDGTMEQSSARRRFPSGHYIPSVPDPPSEQPPGRDSSHSGDSKASLVGVGGHGGALSLVGREGLGVRSSRRPRAGAQSHGCCCRPAWEGDRGRVRARSHVPSHILATALFLQ